MMSNKQLKDAVIRTMSLEEIESLKMDAMKYRGARGAINQQELEDAAMLRASQLQERVVNEEIKREERKANRLLAVQRPATSTDYNQQKLAEMKAYIKELETTVKTMHQDIRQTYSADKMKEVIADIMRD